MHSRERNAMRYGVFEHIMQYGGTQEIVNDFKECNGNALSKNEIWDFKSDLSASEYEMEMLHIWIVWGIFRNSLRNKETAL